MDDLKIVGWVDFESRYPSRKLTNDDLFKTVLSLIQDEICNGNYIFSGEEHQNSLTGVPLFSDGTCFRASMRAWGNIMASVYCGAEGQELTYMDFYTSLGDDSVLPEYKEIDVEPAILEDDEISIGCALKPDRQIVEESISLGMPFITNDKVLEKMYEKLKAEK